MIRTVTKQDLINRIEKDLKDKEFSSLGITYRGVTVDPIYSIEETKPLQWLEEKQNNHWDIAQYYKLQNATEDNKQILKDLLSGVNALILDFTQCKDWSEQDLYRLFQEVQLQYIGVHIRNVPNVLHGLLKQTMQKLGAPCCGSCDALSVEGYHYPVIPVNTNMDLVTVLTALNNAVEKGNRPHIDWVIGEHYFGEIASLRAIRYLWEKILIFYKQPLKLSIIGLVISDTNTVDINGNMIRNTIKAMSGALGGVHTLSVEPHEGLQGSPSENSFRVARNIQLIMQEESGLHRVPDPAAGSFLIENFSTALAEYVWNRFQQT